MSNRPGLRTGSRPHRHGNRYNRGLRTVEENTGSDLRDAVAASLCRGALALLLVKARRHSAVATIPRICETARLLGLWHWSGSSSRPSRSTGLHFAARSPAAYSFTASICLSIIWLVKRSMAT